MMNFLNTLKTVFGQEETKTTSYLEQDQTRKAFDLIHNGKDDEAYNILVKETEDHPDNGYAHYGIAVIGKKHEDYSLAFNAITNALRHLQKDKVWFAAAFNQRGDIYNAMGKEERALDDWAKSHRLNPYVTKPLESQAEYYFAVGIYDKSDELFSKIAELEPGNPYPVVAIGRNAIVQGRYEEAQKQFEYATKLAPDYHYSFSFLAETLLQKEDWEGAVENAVKALKIMPGDQKAETIIMNKIPADKASLVISKLEAMSREDSNNAYWPHLLGNLYFFRENDEEAAKFYKECFKRNGGSVPLGNLARALYRKGDYYNARYYAGKALELEPANANAQDVMARTLLDQDLYEEAREALESYLPHYPNGVGLLALLSETYRFCGDLEKALETINTAIKLNPNNGYLYQIRSKVYVDSGRKKEAEEDLEKLLSMVPERDEFDAYRCFALQCLGRNEEAWKELDKGEKTKAGRANYELDKALSLAIDGRNEEALEMLHKAFEDGLVRFAMLRNAASLEPLRRIPHFNEEVTLANYLFRARMGQMALEEAKDEPEWGETAFTSNGDCLCVMGDVNGLPLKFVFDTGASDITISSVEAAFMLKNGYLEEYNLGGVKQYRTASGEIIEGTVVNLRNVTFGGVTFHDIRASIIKNQEAPLLLGQSMLARMMQFYVDYEKNKIRFVTKTAILNDVDLECLAWKLAEIDHDEEGAARVREKLEEIRAGRTDTI